MMLKALGFEVVKIRDLHPILQILVVIIAILVAFVFSGLFISYSGGDPIEAFAAMFKGAFGDRRKVLETLLRSTPLMLAGLATVIAFRAQIWSIGQEGQLLAGAMLSFAMYRIFQPILVRPALLIVIVISGFLGGALLGLISGWMKARFNVDIIISTVLMNYIVTTMLLFLLYDHKYWMGANNYYPRSDYVTEDSWYPILTQDSRLHMGFLIAVGLAILIYWILKRTPYGFDLRALGANPIATQFKGINVNKLIVVTMFFSGGLAGLAGAGELFGVHHNVSMGISPGYGYTGIIVAMVAELNPLIVILVAILFGGFINGSVVLATITGTHTSIIFVIQAFVLLSVLIGRALMTYRIRRIEHVG
jgi:general nucleoside transport system permease protein